VSRKRMQHSTISKNRDNSKSSGGSVPETKQYKKHREQRKKIRNNISLLREKLKKLN